MVITFKVYELVRTQFEAREQDYTPLERVILEESAINPAEGFTTKGDAIKALAADGEEGAKYTILDNFTNF